MINDDREKLSSPLERLKHQLYAEMRGRMVPTPKAVQTRKEIDIVQARINALDKEATERLALSKAPIDSVLEVIAIPLLADVMNDLVAGVDATLIKAGVQGTVFSTYTNQIRRLALAMVDTLEHGEETLPKLLEVDDTLVDAVKKKLMSFIKQRLKITK